MVQSPAADQPIRDAEGPKIAQQSSVIVRRKCLFN